MNKEKESLKEKQNENIQSRRRFLKKAYAAPVLVALGGLAKPTNIKAGFTPPPSGPGFP